MDLAQLGIQVDSRPAVKAVDDLDDLALAAQRAENATEDLGAASKRMVPALGGVAKGSALAGQNSRQMAPHKGVWTTPRTCLAPSRPSPRPVAGR